jgi:AcrR family transcriptional regulator
MNTRKPVVETTKEAMLRVAIAAIDDGGEDGIRLDAILQEVGVSPSSLYYHYGNLAGLVEAAQVERFRRANLNNAIEVRQRIELVESVDEFKKLVDLLIKNFLGSHRSIPRLQRANALGSAFGRPELLQLLGESQAEALNIGVEAIELAQQKGFVREDLNARAFVAWFDSQSFGRVLVELTQDEELGDNWNNLATEAVYQLLFGDKLKG